MCRDGGTSGGGADVVEAMDWVPRNAVRNRRSRPANVDANAGALRPIPRIV